MKHTTQKGAAALATSIVIVLVVIIGFLGYAILNAKGGQQSSSTDVSAMTGDSSAASGQAQPSGQMTAQATQDNSSQSMPTSGTTGNDAPVADTMKASGKFKYKDGSYSATGSYDSPGGLDQLGVLLTLKDDVVVSASVTPGANDRESARYQQRFINGYSSLVVGKNIDSIRLDVVSGSSLTPMGFNDALSQIKAKAII